MARVLIAGGGTGGHFFSGMAVGEAFAARDPKNQVVYVGTRSGIEARVGPREGLDVRFVRVSGLKGKGAAARVAGLLRLPLSLWDSLVLLLRLRPALVVGVGGYASGPVVMAAKLLRRPTAIVEQNSIPGFTNRVLGRVVDRVFTAFPETEAYFPRRRVVFTGNPIRRRLAETLTLENRSSPGLSAGGEVHVLAFGGSQGARSLNRAMVAMVTELPADLRGRIRLVHQTGEHDHAEVAAGYARAGFDHVEVLPFIHDMAGAYHGADLVVCRAGASTLAEVTVSRRPSVLVPYPHAIYNHQELNARSLVERGAAVMLLDRDLNGASLAGAIAGLVADPERLSRMAAAAADLGRPQAALDVVDECYRLAGLLRSPRAR